MIQKINFFDAITLFLLICIFPLFGQLPSGLSGKTVFKGEYPLTCSFRGTQQTAATYGEYENLIKKAGTHIPDLIDPNFFDDSNMKWANQMAGNYPDRLFTQVMQAGSGMPDSLSPWPTTVDRICRLPVSFPGHWVVKPPTVLTQSISSSDTSLLVQSTTGFTIVNTYMPVFPNGCPAMLVETDLQGNKLWNHFEYIYVTAISGNQLTISRAYRDSPPASAFTAGRTCVAPLIVEKTWNEPPVWYINMSASCPLDASGKTAAQVMLEDLAHRFGPDGSLSNFSGVDYASGPFTTPPADADFNWDGTVDSANVYYTGVKSFLANLNQKFGGNFVVLSGDNNENYFGFFNGLNNEGLVAPQDPWREITNSLNGTSFWAKFSTLPYVTEEVLRIDQIDNISKEDYTSKWIQLVRMGTGYATCLGSCVNVKTKVFTNATTDPNVVSLTWIELYKGTENVEHWLGKQVSPVIHAASKTQSLLGNSANDWANIIKKLSVQNGTLTVEGNELVYTPSSNQPNHFLTLSLNLKQTNNLTVLFDIISDGNQMVNLINRPSLSVSYQTGADSPTEFSNTDYLTREYYWRGLDSTATGCTVTFNFKSNDKFRFRSMSAHEVPDAMARAFEHGVVLVNPGLEDMTFNLDTLFGRRGSYKRLTAPNVTVSAEWQAQYLQTLEQNSGAPILDPTQVIVPPLNALFLISEATTSGVKKDPISEDATLTQNYPNPFNATTVIKYSIPQTEFVSVKIYDALGREIYTLVNEMKQRGKYETKFDGTFLSSGVYFYQIRANAFVQTKKFVLMK